MIIFLWILAIGLEIMVLAYNQASALVASIAGFVGLILISVFSPFHIAVVIFLWLLLIAFTVIFNPTPVRRLYLTKYIFSWYRKVLPTMSETEREAIDAGTVDWEGQLFSGAPKWDEMLKRPPATLSEEEQAFIDGPVEELCKMLDDWDITHNRADLPENVWTFLKKNKFFAMIIPKEYGGLDFSATANSAVVTKVAAVSITAATTICVPNSLGPAELLHKYGTREQQDYYLPRLAVGDEIPCFALTGPTAGSDATSIPDLGVVCRGKFEGKEITGIRLTFNKRYITLAPVATVIGLAFHMVDPDHLLGEKDDIGITCALLPRNTKGMKVGRRHFPLNTPFQNGPLHGKNVFIPLDYIIGGAKMAGRGWTMLVECLSVGRGISLPAMATGGAKLAVRIGGAYCRIRQQFGLPIGKFEGVGEALARSIVNTYIMDATREMTLAAIDRGGRPAVLTAISKFNVTELGRKVANDIMDVHGGKGICLGPNNYLGRGYQSVPISITVEGANILTRSMIIFGQGAIRCHPWIFSEMHAALDTDQDRGLTNFDKSIFGHIGFIFSNIVRSFVLALTGSRMVLVPNGPGKRYFQQFTRLSSAFALLADMAMITVGGDLKRKESLSARLGDILGNLCMGSAVLKRFYDDGCPKEDIVLLDYACQMLLNEIQQNINGILQNFPNRYVALLARFTIFPVGQHFGNPKDTLAQKVVQLFLEPSAGRDRLTRGLSLSKDAIHPAGRVDETLEKVIAIEPLEKRIKEAVKDGKIHGYNYDGQLLAALAAHVISKDEHAQILEAHGLRMQLINVDDFDTAELVRVFEKEKP